MSEPEPVYWSLIDTDEYELVVRDDTAEGLLVQVFRPGASTTRYAVYLPDDAVDDLIDTLVEYRATRGGGAS